MAELYDAQGRAIKGKQDALIGKMFDGLIVEVNGIKHDLGVLRNIALTSILSINLSMFEIALKLEIFDRAFLICMEYLTLPFSIANAQDFNPFVEARKLLPKASSEVVLGHRDNIVNFLKERDGYFTKVLKTKQYQDYKDLVQRLKKYVAIKEKII